MQGSKFTKVVLSFLLCLSYQVAAQVQDLSIGKVYTYSSEKLKEQREYRVLLPESYKTGDQHYPVIYVLDGASYYLSAYSAVVALAGQSNMPESIVVAVSNPDRTSDMTPPDMRIPSVQQANADKFLGFLADELIPYIDKSYRTRPLRVLIGHSHGGIFSLYALSARPETFGWHIALDAPMHLDKHYLEKGVENFIKQNPKHAGRLVVGWSRYEWSSERWMKLEERADRGFKAWQIDLPEETHSSMYHMGMYKGLKRLFADHEYRHDQVLTLAELDKRYQAMNKEYGYEIPVPLWALRYGALEHLTSANPTEARPFVERLIQDTGSPMVLDDNALEWLEKLEKDPPTETREDYITKPDASPSEIKDYLGIWKNDKYRVEIYEEEGVVNGKLEQAFPGGETMKVAFTKFVKTKDGSLELSHSNGMPPLSGLLVYRLSVPKNGSLSGERTFKVYWPRMEGRSMPERFVLSKE
ncbi:MAG: alpha/beta hydrolase [Roseivirga sp.]|nr:alpha/beta hydrolase [Roseivirga sp.]